MKKWRCLLCNYVYDETKGNPDKGIPAGTRWQNVPSSWVCPSCGATKADFILVK
ncbi:MAG: rubredoxin [Pseudomonadota bacterium]